MLMADAVRLVPDALPASAPVAVILLSAMLIFVALMMMLRSQRTASKDDFECVSLIQTDPREEAATEPDLNVKVNIEADSGSIQEAPAMTPLQDRQHHDAGLAPGLALLEQYCVFGVPSGSWSGHSHSWPMQSCP